MEENNRLNTECDKNTDIPVPADEQSAVQPAVKKKGGGFREMMTRAGEIGTRAYTVARDRVQDHSEQQQTRRFEERMRKYNPLFEEEYSRDDFKLPYVIVITAASKRNEFDVCEGAVAYRTIEKEVEVLHLFDDSLEILDIQFSPNAMCNSAYIVHPHNPRRYVSVDEFFSMMHDEKFAELQHIAYSLGASRYEVEIAESESENHSSTRKLGGNIRGRASMDANTETTSSGKRTTSSSTIVTFTGKREPVHPTLCWYSQDPKVQHLIEMRCSEAANMTEYSIHLNSSISASMSRSTAAQVQAALVQMKLSCNLQMMCEEEHSRSLIFKLKF